MPETASVWDTVLERFLDKEVILLLEGAPVEPFSAMKGVVKKDDSTGLFTLRCRSGRGPNGEVAPGGTLYFQASQVRRIYDAEADPTPTLV